MPKTDPLGTICEVYRKGLLWLAALLALSPVAALLEAFYGTALLFNTGLNIIVWLRKKGCSLLLKETAFRLIIRLAGVSFLA